MNKQKVLAKQRKIINLIRFANRKPNCLRFYKNETESHKRKKFEVFIKFQELGFDPIFTECIFQNGKRADLLALKEETSIIIEVLESESIENYEEKIKDYPKLIDYIHSVKDLKDIKDLESYR